MGLKECRFICFGFMLGFFLYGCAFAFPYRFYGLDAASYEGKMLGPSPKDDLEFKECKPDEPDPKNPDHKPNKGKCVVLFSQEFYQFKNDYLDTKQKLSDCQKNQIQTQEQNP